MRIPPLLRFVRPSPWPAGALTLPKLQAHRGFWKAGFQENTIPAFRAAKAAGFQIAELDVQISREGEAVVFHDDDLQRLAGDSRDVREFTAPELLKRAQAPLLRDVLSDAAGPDFFNVEIKAPTSIAGKVEPAVAQAIRDARAEHRVLISSFNPFTLVLIAELLPNVPRALLASSIKEPGNPFSLRHMLFAPFVDVHMVNLDDRMMTPEMISQLRAQNLPFAVWTVNDPARAQELLIKGAASVITDRVRPADIEQ